MLSQQIINGLMLGSIYAFIAVGYTLIFGVLRMLNLAHAHLFMAAPFIALYAMVALGLPPVAAIFLAFVACAALGVLLYYVAFKPIPPTHALGGFVTSLSFGVILQVIVVNRFGSLNQRFTTNIALPDFQFGSVILSGIQLLSLIFSLALMVGLLVMVKRTKMGRDIRAIAENPLAASLLGVRPERAVLRVFALSGFLAALAGILVAIRFETINAYMSNTYALKALAIIVIGGLGDLRGAMIAGLLLGLIEVLFQAYLPAGFSEAFVWIALIVILLIKPEGIVGKGIEGRQV